MSDERIVEALRVSTATVETVPVDSIVVGIRRRTHQKPGPLKIALLKKSIAERGLLHPIILDDEGQLVAGFRRLEAAKALGWTKIQAKRLCNLSSEELRRLEWEENVQRLNYRDAEMTEARSREITKQEREQREREEAERLLSADNGGKKAPRQHVATGRKASGRPKGVAPGSTRAKAAVAEVSDDTVRRDAAAVHYLTTYPILKDVDRKSDGGLARNAILESGKVLDRLKEANIEQVATPLLQGLPGDLIVKTLRRFENLPEAPRSKLVEMLQSNDREQITNAQSIVTTKKANPPEILLAWKDDVRQCLRRAQTIATRYPTLYARLTPILKQLESTIPLVQAAYEEEAQQWMTWQEENSDGR